MLDKVTEIIVAIILIFVLLWAIMSVISIVSWVIDITIHLIGWVIL